MSKRVVATGSIKTVRGPNGLEREIREQWLFPLGRLSSAVYVYSFLDLEPDAERGIRAVVLREIARGR